MSTPEQPPRLIAENSGASAELRRALAAARGDLPSPEHVEALLSRFPFPDGGGSGGGPSDAAGGAELAAEAAGKSAAIGKWLGIAFLAASAGTAFYATSRPPPSTSETTATVVSATASAVVVATVTVAPPPAPVIEPSAASASASAATTPRATAVLSATASATASASAAPVRPEIEILKEAQASRGNPARMLELVNEHARSHPKGMLGQEREVLRIEALVGLGRRAEAQALADAFRKGNPGSVYAERLNQILPP